MDYLNQRDGSNSIYEEIIWDVLSAYENDITNGCQLYYTPAAMQGNKRPNWNFSLLEEEYIYGVDSEYEGRFFQVQISFSGTSVSFGARLYKKNYKFCVYRIRGFQ